jgi:hypothetical protein
MQETKNNHLVKIDSYIRELGKNTRSLQFLRIPSSISHGEKALLRFFLGELPATETAKAVIDYGTRFRLKKNGLEITEE